MMAMLDRLAMRQTVELTHQVPHQEAGVSQPPDQPHDQGWGVWVSRGEETGLWGVGV